MLTTADTGITPCEADDLCQLHDDNGNMSCIPKITGLEVGISDSRETWGGECDEPSITFEADCISECVPNPDSEQEEQQAQASAAEGDCPNLGGTWSTRVWTPTCNSVATQLTQAECENNTTNFKCNELNGPESIFKKTKCKNITAAADGSLTYSKNYEYKLYGDSPTATPSPTANKYDITANLTEGGIQILTTGNILVGMYLVYEDNNEIKESYISKHEYDNNQHKIELLDSTGQTITSSTSIFPLSIKNKKYFDGGNTSITIKNYVRKENADTFNITGANSVSKKENL